MAGRLLKGKRVVFSGDVDLMPHTIVRRGEQGVITRACADAEGLVSLEVLLDKHHKGLREYDNHAYLEDPELEQVVLDRCAQKVGRYVLSDAFRIQWERFQLITTELLA